MRGFFLEMARRLLTYQYREARFSDALKIGKWPRIGRARQYRLASGEHVEGDEASIMAASHAAQAPRRRRHYAVPVPR